MLLRSAFTPLFTAIPTKNNPPKLAFSTLRSSLAQQCTPSVRQNGPYDPTSPLLLHKLPPVSAYIHLPFCRKRCHYCDFPIIALGSSFPTPAVDNSDDPRISNYVETLCREIMAAKSNSRDCPPLETVYLGGGTPSLVPPRLVSSVLDSLSSKFGVSGNAELSMEMDPGTFDAVAMKELMSLGMNRVSLGIQAFQDELLKSCGRAHAVREIFEAVEIVKSCGVENWSADLISSLPYQTPTMWEESLQLTIEAEPTHVSVYDLQVEQDTKFGVLVLLAHLLGRAADVAVKIGSRITAASAQDVRGRYTPGEFPLPSENQSAEFYKMASRMLTNAGYYHYEISSYCKAGYRSKHNTTYWKNKPFYAFGLGSASYINGVRFSRPRRLKEYMNYVQDLENGLINDTQDWILDTNDLAMDILMLSLRTAEGLDLNSFKEAFGNTFLLSILEVYRPYMESGHVVCLDKQGRNVGADEIISSLSNEVGFLRLSDPDGFLLSNELISLAFGAIGS